MTRDSAIIPRPTDDIAAVYFFALTLRIWSGNYGFGIGARQTNVIIGKSALNLDRCRVICDRGRHSLDDWLWLLAVRLKKDIAQLGRDEYPT